ncbi:hypothetical protein GUITHDRAFT_164235 [Guillardia theta CCMP2712]|uniref:Uncharacterized protein n=1 Tax=Guillardia theta (strain CCMP2712) TaxID=905079 RepID=L1J0P0_GUITC|nr:hypothetical protein GUITHDRAFT_164235 [Guillardia theta CCMP2712]EKX42098.1 hypothetical protein GUITHDRAFT_164235 [Guillardia theta CCMP2712]|eukprot:XP_005829078.1 hypothetical protein GUITHDRAFT_164235 [Guillardia theta CCMP2712]
MSNSTKSTPRNDASANMRRIEQMTTLLDEWNSARKHASHQISRINKESESIHSEMWDLCTQTSDVLDLIVKETTATQQDIEKLQMCLTATEERGKKVQSALESQREHNDLQHLDLISKGKHLQDSFYDKVLRMSAFSRRRLLLHQVCRSWINLLRRRNSLCVGESIVRRRRRPHASASDEFEPSLGADLPSWEISRISMTLV